MSPCGIQAKCRERHSGKTIAGQRTKYERGILFNSAKFFDIEYQTYGFIATNPQHNISSFYWQHPEKELCIRINYESDSQIVTGVNTFGIRMRQAVWQKWLANQCTIKYVLQHLPDANFDPELYKRFEQDVISTFNNQHPEAPALPFTVELDNQAFYQGESPCKLINCFDSACTKNRHVTIFVRIAGFVGMLLVNSFTLTETALNNAINNDSHRQLLRPHFSHVIDNTVSNKVSFIHEIRSTINQYNDTLDERGTQYLIATLTLLRFRSTHWVTMS